MKKSRELIYAICPACWATMIIYSGGRNFFCSMACLSLANEAISKDLHPGAKASENLVKFVQQYYALKDRLSECGATGLQIEASAKYVLDTQDYVFEFFHQDKSAEQLVKSCWRSAAVGTKCS